MNAPAEKQPLAQHSDVERLAQKLANSHPKSSLTSEPLIPRLDTIAALFDRVNDIFLQEARQIEVLSGTAEWLLDNDHIIQTALEQVKRDLPQDFIRRLRRLETDTEQGPTRIYALAVALINEKQAVIDRKEIDPFLHTYQMTHELNMGEIWAFPAMLRLGLLEFLARVILNKVDSLDGKLAALSNLPVSLPDDVPDSTLTGNCIRSLHMIATHDWKDFFETVSLVEATLRKDPAGVYLRMEFETRDRYRKVIEDIARHSEKTESEVSRQVIHLSEQAVEDPRQGHAGYYLLAEGRQRLEEWAGYRPPLSGRFRRLVYRQALLFYTGMNILLTLILSAALPVGVDSIQKIAPGLWAVFFVLTLLPASMIAGRFANIFISRMIPTRVLPKMDFQAGIPAEFQTIIVIPSMLSSPEEIDSLLQQLERHYLSNEDGHLTFALLTDFTDASQPQMPEDRALLSRVEAGISNLNSRYGRERAPFYLFHRDRQWNPGEKRWMGWERKRGKLVEFNELLAGKKETSFSTQIGALEQLGDIRFVITLDADTLLPPETAHRMVGAMAHPLNQPVFDPETNIIRSGYSILQPRVGVQPTSANASLFSKIFSADFGVDLYSSAVSEVYHDLFGEGIFVGKGIYDPAAFQRSHQDCIPDNRLLSHDLFEGILGRTGFLSTIVLYEDFPQKYLAHIQRLHRWVRGDWQLLPWILPWQKDGCPARLSLLDRWKITDNLKRSLEAPGIVTLLLAGWLYLPGAGLAWTLAVMLFSAFPLIQEITAHSLARLRKSEIPGLHISLRTQFQRWGLTWVFLLHTAWLDLHAIGTTLVRLFITHRRLLMWTTQAESNRIFRSQRSLFLVWEKMASASISAAALTGLLAVASPRALPGSIPLLLIWFFSPVAALILSRRLEVRKESLSSDEITELRRLARHTWLFFEHFIGPDDHWLPPDHFQEKPRGTVAHRTSPTNIGLLLTSTLCAHEMGYVGILNLETRVRSAINSLKGLDRYRGHFLNWYGTRRRQPLNPRYVSTVDSGNLAAAMWAVRQGLKVLHNQPVVNQRIWQGLNDTLGMLLQSVEGLADRNGDQPARHTEIIRGLCADIDDLCENCVRVQKTPSDWYGQMATGQKDEWTRIRESIRELVETDHLNAKALSNLRLWFERVQEHLNNMQLEIDLLLPWMAQIDEAPEFVRLGDLDAEVHEAWEELKLTFEPLPNLDLLPKICMTGLDRLQSLEAAIKNRGPVGTAGQEAVEWCTGLAKKLKASRKRALELIERLSEDEEWLANTIQEMKFDFLYDSLQRVFHLGYDLNSEQLDPNHYDLLASEARTASLIAIAKGEVPLAHWLHLRRPIVSLDSNRTLLSWNGSMFEYLMPDLLIRTFPNSLLYQTGQAVVERQIRYASKRGTPWGISESGYYQFDGSQNYQYRGFGVPGLGRKRNLSKDHVISPYASLLAISLAPRAVFDNLSALRKAGALGQFGFYESIDYTQIRMPLNRDHAVVKSYMVHHQGMIFNALANYLLDDVLVRYFHMDPRAERIELLLQERFPEETPPERVPHEYEEGPEKVRAPLEIEAWDIPNAPPWPQAQYITNGQCGVLISDSGSGFTRCLQQDGEQEAFIALTRWRADTTRDHWGTWIYIQDSVNGHTFSAGAQPCAILPDSTDYQVHFSPFKAEFQRREADLSVRMEVSITPTDNVEIRRLTLTNHQAQARAMVLTSYGEAVLAPQAADRQHPAFNKLFIESRYLPEDNILLFRRRPRAADEKPVYMAHFLALESGVAPTGAFETSRDRFLGRGRTTRNPAALEKELSGTTGAVLDPIFALQQQIELEAYGSSRLAYGTLLADSEEKAILLARRYQSLSTISLAFDHAERISEKELGELGVTTQQLKDYQQLVSGLVYPGPALRAPPDRLAENRSAQPALWPLSISGDNPVVVVHVRSPEEIRLVHELLRAHLYWRKHHFTFDLVVLNHKDQGYAQELQDQLHRLVTQLESDSWLNRNGGIFLLRIHSMDPDTVSLVEATARVVLEGDHGALSKQLEALHSVPTRLPEIIPSRTGAEENTLQPVQRPSGLVFDNGIGGFTPDGREYAIYLKSGTWTPAAWSNICANADFGFLTTESGLGFSWAANSGENRLTPWSNDMLKDPPGEVLYLRDEETAQVWTPTRLPAGTGSTCLVRHGAGYSTYRQNSQSLKQTLEVFVAADAAVKIAVLRLENTADRPRRITATYYAEWVLYTRREQAQLYIIPEYTHEHQAFLARNPYNAEFGERIAFLAGSQKPHGVTTDRTEFLGRRGDLQHPAALSRLGLSGTIAAGPDPCAALQLHIEIPAGGSEEVHFLLGQGKDRSSALELIQKYQNPEQVEIARQQLDAFWDELLGSIQVNTPDPAMDVLMNRWLLYQNLSCRIWGRSAGYQSSGAYGFRDQLQDVMAMVHSFPEVTRRHILRAARHQFEAGDVLHWWHPPSGRGVRTRIRDDLLWLPYTVAHYIQTTGDLEILQEERPFLQAPPLEPEEEERYGLFESTENDVSLYQHCLQAIRRGTTHGQHGLPLIGTGDWNDGMNRVGKEGKGESIWLGWFLYSVLQAFAPLCEKMGDFEQANHLKEQADQLRESLRASAWDGEWYRRAYFDDGAPLGSVQNQECQIDSIAQSWSVLSKGGDRERQAAAMQAVRDQLVQPKDRLVLLFTPPFDQTSRDPGYIKGYPPGIRENGGQYTHAAIWAVWAFAEQGMGEVAGELFQLLNPILHSDNPEKAAWYGVEPYVMAADVYSHPMHRGKGGWTWYTGSGGWMYRLGLEAVLGIYREGDRIRLDPCIPPAWDGYEVTYTYGSTRYRIRVENPEHVQKGVTHVRLDDRIQSEPIISLSDDGRTHRVIARMG